MVYDQSITWKQTCFIRMAILEHQQAVCKKADLQEEQSTGYSAWTGCQTRSLQLEFM